MAKAGAEALTRRERQIMDILHRRGHATAHEVLEDIADPPSYSSVRALLRLLEERGHIKHVEDGTRYVYSPVAGKSDARRSALAHVVRTFFAGLGRRRSCGARRVAKVEALARRARTPRRDHRPREERRTLRMFTICRSASEQHVHNRCMRAAQTHEER